MRRPNQRKNNDYQTDKGYHWNKLPGSLSGNYSNLNYQEYNPVELKSPDPLIQSEMTSSDFSHALFTSMDLIPDIPLEMSDYNPQNPAETPDNYPKKPNVKLLQPDFFRRYDMSTLFYIFFYFPGTTQQLFAGRELKQRGWIFHNKYQTWFHRLSEPTEINDNYEIGSFEYFDRSTQECWCVRVRDSFKLEYDCLDAE